MVITGLERLLNGDYPELSGKRIGLVINHTSVDHLLRFSLDELLKQGYTIQAVFSPEHGLRGDALAGEKVHHEVDRKTGIPVYSLYGERKIATEVMLKDIEVLIFDMQDMGVRFYTYIYTMANMMKSAAEQQIPFYVLDRPNPITGVKVEGNLISEAFCSFVGDYGLPIRHGMTIGEVATYINHEFHIGCELTVISMEKWSRRYWFDETGLQWVMPSPNATSLDMAALYPGMCFFEGTNLSEGRGTTKPFEIIGSPWIKSEEWIESLSHYQLDGVLFREVNFKPFTSKYSGELCQGVQVHITNREQLQPITIALAMLQTVRNLYPQQFHWIPPFKNRYFIDLLTGTDQVRSAIDRQEDVLQWYENQRQDVSMFEEKRRNYLLYD